MHPYKPQRPTMPPQNARPPEWLCAVILVTMTAALAAVIMLRLTA